MQFKLKRDDYDGKKADVYSFTVVIMELLLPRTNRREVDRALKNARKRKRFPEQFGAIPDMVSLFD